MRNFTWGLFLTLFLFSNSNLAEQPPTHFDNSIKKIISSHFQTYQPLEYFSGIAVAIYLPEQAIKNYYFGKEAHTKESANISATTLFQIGSITKSFTAVLLLQLEKEKKLKLSDTVADWLSQYTHWGKFTLTRLLNMTTGLPNYSDAPLWNAAITENPMQLFTAPQLIDYVYPKLSNPPPLKTGYFYTNTNYILAELIAEKATQTSFQAAITHLIKRADLKNTYYPVPQLAKNIETRLAHGYNYNPYDNPSLVGKDVTQFNLSWASAAGALIANAEDIIKWVQTLFINTDLLDTEQKHKLKQINSTKDGLPIKFTSAENPHGFGLGIAQGFNKEMGNYWFYEGETLGFRAFYAYIPCNGIIIASIFNSAVNDENDHGGELIKQIYQEILRMNPKLTCHPTTQT